MDIKVNCPKCNTHRVFDFTGVSEYTKEQMTDGKSATCPECGTVAIIRTSGLPLHALMPGKPLYQFSAID